MKMAKKLMKSLLLLFMWIWFTQSFCYWDLQSFLVEKYYKTQDSFKDLPSSTQLWNIYNSAYEAMQNQEFADSKISLDTVMNFINSRYSCDMTKTEIYNVFGMTPDGKSIISWISKKNMAWETELLIQWDSFIYACKKLSNCLAKWDVQYQRNEESQTYYSPQVYDSCLNMVASAYRVAKLDSDTFSNLIQTNYWDDIYINWTMQDSSFDILVDIQNIGKLLFDKNKEAKSLRFYSYSSDSWNWWDEDSSGNGNSWNNDWNNLWNNGSSWVYTEDDSQMLGYYTDNGLAQAIDDVNSNSSTSYDWLIQNADCNVQDTDVDNSSQTSSSQWSQSINDLYDYNTSLSSNYPDSSSTSDGQTWTEFLNSSKDYLLNWGFSGVLWEEDDEFKKCMVNASYDDIYKITVCWVQSRVRSIPKFKSVLSVQEMVDEINNVLLYLIKSGQIMPHNKVDENWQISFENMNFADLFSFDFVLVRKPLFKWKDKRADKQNKEAKYTEYQQRYLWPWEKNKYINMLSNWDIDDQKAKRQPADTVNQVFVNIENYQSMMYDLTSDSSQSDFVHQVSVWYWNYEYLSQVAEFMNWNIEFWRWVDSIFDAITAIWQNLYLKLQSQR